MSLFVGSIPGPGGIPVFLAGIAILASEFSWAERLRDLILEYIRLATDWYKQNFALGNITIAISTTLSILVVAYLY